MKVIQSEYGTSIWISARETAEWATQPGKRWPCSELAGRRVFAAFDARGNLVDMAIDGRTDTDCDATEFDALTSDFLAARFGSEHPAIR